ncbi:MAG: hypothetical protein NZ529_02990 [Cytophagaceae bacterium]|nr:hypothetical protein [Cytophagaceae bacterium]MDW8455736.1 hypothetical protein [Cytophagaceae bacterium]
MKKATHYIALLLLFAFVAIASPCNAQEETAATDYDKEIIGGINFNTNAGLVGGIMGRYSIRQHSTLFKILSAEIVNVKHPNETRYQNQSTGNIFIAGKQNYFFVTRLQAGIEKVLFRKASEDGVQVDLLMAGGLSFGLLKPYFIQYNNGSTVTIEAYDPKIHDFNRIEGSAGILTGIEKSKLKPGLNFKTGMSFEFGTFSNGVSGLEAGVGVEIFNETIIILNPLANATSYNKKAFTWLYANIYFGMRR